jgi:hypothetical protein
MNGLEQNGARVSENQGRRSDTMTPSGLRTARA